MSQPSMDLGAIAIVEDEPVIRRLMCLWLEADGYEVVEYSSGREALQSDARGTAIVCLDLRLEDMPGQAVLAELHARDPEIPILVVTGDDASESAAAAMRAGAYEYVTKPFDRDRLAQAVGRAMEHRRLLERVRGLQRELEERAERSSLEGDGSMRDEAPRPTMGGALRLLDPTEVLAQRPPLSNRALDDLTEAERDEATSLNLREIERAAISRALRFSGGSVGKAAKLLGIGRATLYRRLSEQRSPLSSRAAQASPDSAAARLNGHELART